MQHMVTAQKLVEQRCHLYNSLLDKVFVNCLLNGLLYPVLAQSVPNLLMYLHFSRLV